MPTKKKTSKTIKSKTSKADTKVKKAVAKRVRAVSSESETPAAPTPQTPELAVPEGRYFLGIGRRKTATCTVRLYQGKGEISVNSKPIEQYFPEPFLVDKIVSPLSLVGKDKSFEITVKVSGGGKNAQAEAIRLGIARALVESDPELRLTLKREGFLSRDARAKERKKYGLKRARKAPQFSKR
jgi:small subunit ribosomal protein S9